jgi:hypothetical protein
MNFYKMDDGELVNLDCVTRILPATKEFGAIQVRLVMTNGAVVTLTQKEWHHLESLILSYTWTREPNTSQGDGVR